MIRNNGENSKSAIRCSVFFLTKEEGGERSPLVTSGILFFKA